MPANPIAAGRKGGRSRSAAKLAAARRNGFQPQKVAAQSEAEKPQPVPETTIQPALFIRAGQPKRVE